MRNKIYYTHWLGSDSASEDDSLRKTFERRVASAEAEMLKNDGQIKPGRIEELERLEKLLALRDQAFPPSSTSKWPVILLMLLTLVIVSGLLFCGPTSTEIEARITATELGLQLPDRIDELNERVEVVSIIANGLQRVDGIYTTNTNKNSTHPFNVGLSRDAPRQPSGRIALNKLEIPSNTTVWVRNTGASQEYALALRSDNNVPVSAGIDFVGAVKMAGSPGGPPDTSILADIPDKLVMHSSTERLEMDMTLSEDEQLAFLPNLTISSLHLTDMRLTETLPRSGNETQRFKTISTVQKGFIYLMGLGGEEREIRAGEIVRLDSPRGVIQGLRTTGNHIQFIFRGSVENVYLGGQSLMPSWLEWWSSQEALYLLWGAILYLFGVFTAVYRWWNQ